MKCTAPCSKKTLNDIDIQIGKRLRVRRTSLGMTQEELGSTLNVTFQQIQKYERGINRISSAALYEISKALNTNINYFFDTSPEKIIPQNMPYIFADNTNIALHESLDAYQDLESSDDIETLVKSYLNIRDPKVRESILKLIKSLSSE